MRKFLSDDRGETLLELVMAIVIAGVCVVAIGSGIALSVKISDVHRQQAIAGQYLHDYAEVVQSSYVACTSGATHDYSSGLPSPSNGGPWKLTQSAIKYWNGTAFTATCPATDPGLQQVTLELQTTDGLVDESLVVVVGAP
jgi:type II secretory pathway pseudopilin PulG